MSPLVCLMIKIAVGCCLGLLCKYICNVIEEKLLSKRNLQVKRIRIQEMIVCAFMMIVGAGFLVKYNLVTELIYAFIILCICEMVIMIDLHHRIIPNGLLLTMLIAKVAIGIPGLFNLDFFPKFEWMSSLIGLIVGFAIFMIPAIWGRAIGLGDVKLASCIGFCVGFQQLLYTIILMGLCVLAYTVVQTNKTLRNMMLEMIPMGPFISVSMIIIMILY